MQYVDEDQIPKKISKIQFCLPSSKDVLSASVVEVNVDNLYEREKRVPADYGPLDLRMGTTDKNAVCATCGEKLVTCPGHFGHVRLFLPVFHLGYLKATITILNCICKTCSRVLLPAADHAMYLRLMRSPRTDSLKRASLLKKLSDTCKKQHTCRHCGAHNGLVKKVKTLMRLVHDVYAKHDAARNALIDRHHQAIDRNGELLPLLRKMQEDLDPLRVLCLFENITDIDCEVLDMNPAYSRPADLLISHLTIPPTCIRPSVAMVSSAGSNEDDLTVKLAEIIRMNTGLYAAMLKGAQSHAIMESWLSLQLLVATYYNAEMPGAAQTMSKTGKMKPMRGFYQRLKGKMGRFRGNLSGKRVDHSGRTVISPDPNVAIDQVVVPRLVAQILTYPERVTIYNKERLQMMVRNGPDVWPGANHITDLSGGKRFLGFGDREKAADGLKLGYVVERHLLDDDIVLFNRQPSLHRISIMCHRAKILPWRTFRFNECCCTPYNADFDGDEMNLHVPQTEEARAEARELMGVTANLVTPRNGDPLIAATQDFLTGAFLLTRKNTFYTRAQFTQICAYLADATQHITLPPPSLLKPVPLWTGKQVFGILLKPNEECKINVNLEIEEAGYVKGTHCMCPHDGFVIFRNSQLMCGHVGKNVLGKETKTSIFYVLMRDYSASHATLAMSRLAKMTSRWITAHGFTIGIEDVTPSPILSRLKQELMTKGDEECASLIAKWKRKELETMRGCNEEQTLETMIKAKLNNLRGEASKACMQTLHWDNKPLIMALCKSKGSEINIAQMIACVGQQVIGDVRIPDGFIQRALPHFPKGSKIPAAKGFVSNSFFSGMTATEFFFHTMAGRVGLVDTAVKTAETGYMQRRLMKALEDLSLQYDYTVRNSEGGIVQFQYGDDSLDPGLMEGQKDGEPINFARLMVHYQVVHVPPKNTPPLSCGEIQAIYDEWLTCVRTKSRFSSRFLCSLQEYLSSLAVERDSDRRWGSGVGVTRAALRGFLNDVFRRYHRQIMEPGTPVGALCGQSIGEPGTQMTLKTFHFAGVESMNVTLGVPRIKEIINAAKHISTPYIEAALEDDSSEVAARAIKGRIEKTLLGDIASSVVEVWEGAQTSLIIKISEVAIQRLQLSVSLASIRDAIIAAPKLKVKDKMVRMNPQKKQVIVDVPMSGTGKDNPYFILQFLRKNLPNVIISGVPTVTRAVINKLTQKTEDGRDRFRLVVEGVGLKEVMAAQGIKGKVTRTNHIMEVAEVLGIEAARRTIIDQLHYTMCDAHGLKIDPRHTSLLADLMSFKGEVLGITRFGIKKMKESVLMLASFEKTVDNLFEAAVHSRCDQVNGVSECIIMGTPIPLGTGLFKILQHHPQLAETVTRTARPRPPLLSLVSRSHHVTLPHTTTTSSSSSNGRTK